MTPNPEHHEHEEAITAVDLPFEASSNTPRGEAPAVDGPAPQVHSRLMRFLVGAGALVLLIVVAGVFLVLPHLVASDVQQEAEQATPPVTAPKTAEASNPPQVDPEERARLAEQTESLLAKLLTQQQQLKAISAPSWGGDDWARYSAASAAGDEAYVNKLYKQAVARYSQALELGKALLQRSAAVMQHALAAGQQALVAGKSQIAIRQFKLVLDVEPGNKAAKAGFERARKLPRVLALTRKADKARAGGKLKEAAAAYGQAVAVDGLWKPAVKGLAVVKTAMADRRFDTRMSEGFDALSAGDYTAARKHFNAALTQHPSSTEAQNGLVQAAQGIKLDTIKLAHARAVAFEARELWERAIGQYQAALEADSNLDFARKGLARARKRAGLDKKLKNLIENPQLLFSDRVLAGAKRLLAEAQGIPDPGRRLKGQISGLGALITTASTPLPVELKSDGHTRVTVYRVGRLGTFSVKQIKLRPGRYTAVGSRDGYRDVRKSFMVLPGQDAGPVSVVCVEPI